MFRRSADASRHLAPLRRSPAVTLVVNWQGSTWTLPPGAAGLLWELSAQEGSDRRIAALASQVPSASYSATASPGLAELSRSLGFRQHLMAPLRLEDVERALGLPAVIDLADRLDAAAPRLARLASRPEIVANLMRAANSSTDPAVVSTALVTRVSEWLPLTAWAVIAVEPDGVMQWLAGRELEATFKGPAEMVADAVMRSGQATVRVSSYVTNPVTQASGPAPGQAPVPLEASVLGWPLVANGEIVAVLVGVDHGHARRLPKILPELGEALTRLVEPAAFALAQALRVARAEALSVTDDLTQLYNSRFLNEALRRETKRAMRSGWPLSLLFIDLDGFKRINDLHGHLLGSRALIEAAAVIRGSARETDIVARFGGDEFAIVLPETGAEGARSVARRLRDRIARYVFLAEHGPSNRLTASIGVATLPDVAETAEALLQAADAAMYRVKVHGKNGIQVAGRDNEPETENEEEQELR